MGGRKRGIYPVSISNRRCDCGVFRYIDYVVSGSEYCRSVSGAYIDFYIRCWRSGQSDCEGGAGSWKTAVCMHNAVMRFARVGGSSSSTMCYRM